MSNKEKKKYQNNDAIHPETNKKKGSPTKKNTARESAKGVGSKQSVKATSGKNKE